MAGLTLFVFCLNLMFPLVSDDLCELEKYQIYGPVKASINLYTDWNARVGAILSVFLGPKFTGLPFDIVNTLVFATILVLVHPVLFARRANSGRDGWFIFIFFTLLSVSTVFGAVFLWREGSLVYAWALALILLHFSVFRYHYTGIKSWYDTASTGVVFLFSVLGFIAGMSSFDLGALGCLLHVCIFAYRRVNGYRDGPRFWLPAACFIIGFLVLYTAPGTRVRANYYESYTSLSQIFSWLLAFEFPRITEHFLHALGRSMYKTNYLVLFASIATARFIFKFQSRQELIPLGIRYLLLGYTALLVLLIALLFAHTSEPGGDALTATILFCNFALSVIALFYLGKNRLLTNDHYSTLVIVVLLHCLMIIDVSAFSVGVIPARRAYLGASVLAALILTVIIQANWKALTQRYIFVSLFILSASTIVIETWGLHVTEKILITEALEKLTPADKILIETDYKILKAPQFYDWSLLTTDKNKGINRCYSRVHGVAEIALVNDVQEVNLAQYLKYLASFERLF